MISSPIGDETSHKWPQIVAVIVTMISVVNTGLSYGWPSPAIIKLSNKDLGFEVTRQEISYIVMLFPLSHSIAYPISALLLDKIGRKKFISLIAIPQTVSWIFIAASTNVYMLYMSRISSGFASGLSLIGIPIYICEIAEPRVRGKLGVPYSISIILGSLLINIYGSHMSLRNSAYVSLPLPLLFQFLFIWIPESPYFYILKGQPEHARNSLKWFRRMDNVERELHALTVYVELQMLEVGSFKQLFTVQTNRRALLILMGVRTVQQFTGGTVFNYYTQFLFSKNDTDPIMGAIIFNVILLVCGVFATFAIDKYGRRILLMLSTTGNSLCLLTEGIFFALKHEKYNVASYKWVSLAGLYMFPICHGIGLSIIPTLLSGELFASNIKAKAVGVSAIYYSICVTAASKAFDYLDYYYEIHMVFFFYFAFGFFGLIFVYYCVPETRNRTLAEIQLSLRRN